jgi:aspartyl-tRNA(Asn)/glutamyl-tRNA(Gln) amidotransferase subunit C
MSLTIDEVQRVAYLSRIQLSDSEVAKFQQQLSSVLDYINTLNELDTSDIAPTLSVTGATNCLREDSLESSLPQSSALQNAKHKNSQYFITPAVFE